MRNKLQMLCWKAKRIAARAYIPQTPDSSPRTADHKKYLDFGFKLLKNVDRFYEGATLAIKLQISPRCSDDFSNRKSRLKHGTKNREKTIAINTNVLQF